MSLLGTIAVPQLTRTRVPAIQEPAAAILRCLFKHRRLAFEAGDCAREECGQCLALHLPKVRQFVQTRRPIHCILPAFPAKSPSRRKTLGPLPDKAEELALLYLESVCREVSSVYPPGLRLTLCSDGHVFSDLVKVSDDDVTLYGRTIADWLRRLSCRSLDTFDLSGVYDGLDHTARRNQLIADHARPIAEIEERARRFEQVRALVNGIHRFLFEEQAELQPERSRSQVRQECRSLAYQLVRRSEAWSRLLANRFPSALRLSIHPQHPHAEKIGILLGETEDVWQTPWHGVALRTASGWKFVKRHEAEALGARLVERDGRGRYFELPPGREPNPQPLFPGREGGSGSSSLHPGFGNGI